MPYEITIDRPLRLLRVAITGLPDADTVGDYERELKRHIGELIADGGSFDILVDLRESQVVAQQDLPQLQARMRWYVDNGLRRSALIITSALLRMQTRRVAPDDRFQYFTSEAEAMAWLQQD